MPYAVQMVDWIRTKERLPGRHVGWVLVCADFQRHSGRKALIANYDYFTETWRTALGAVPAHWKITHWMPLPRLPGWREKSDNK